MNVHYTTVYYQMHYNHKTPAEKRSCLHGKCQQNSVIDSVL